VKKDHLLPFIFEEHPIKGSIVILDDSWQKVIKNHSYPSIIEDILGELLACSVLFSSSLKFDGSFSIQIQGTGPIRMLIAECNSKLQIRATASLDQDYNFTTSSSTFLELIDNANLIISINPRKSNNAYQSMVPLISNSIEEIFESFLLQSEQVASRIKLFSQDGVIGGILLQKLPSEIEEESSSSLWDHLSLALESCYFADLKDSETVLSSLAQNEELRLFSQKSISFSCNCTREKISEILQTLGEIEAKDIIKNEGSIKVTCEFCQETQEFDSIDVATLFSQTKGPGSIH
jgi:molecular chaperone Hsp33